MNDTSLRPALLPRSPIMAHPDLAPMAIPPLTVHTHTVIFLHGRGDTAQNFLSALQHTTLDSHARSLITNFPSIKWVLPQAPRRVCANLPYSWHQWFDIWDTREPGEREEEISAPGLREVVPALRELIADEARILGGCWDRVILAGISMGCATGVQTLVSLRVPEGGGGRLGAFMGFSGRTNFVGRDVKGMRNILELGGRPEDDRALETTPILLQHCVDDEMVPVRRGRNLAETLRDFGVENLEYKEYRTGGHWFNSPEGMDDVVAFIRHFVFFNEDMVDAAPPRGTKEADDGMDVA